MRSNIGIIDLVIRAMLGLAFVAGAAKDGISTPGSALAVVIGACLLATGIFRYCPLYQIFGWSTCGVLDRSAER